MSVPLTPCHQYSHDCFIRIPSINMASSITSISPIINSHNCFITMPTIHFDYCITVYCHSMQGYIQDFYNGVPSVRNYRGIYLELALISCWQYKFYWPTCRTWRYLSMCSTNRYAKQPQHAYSRGVYGHAPSRIF